MSYQVIRSLRFGIVLGAAVSLLQAAPRLAISPQTAFTVPVVTGQNGTPITVDAGNRGDGTLNLTVTSSVTWLSASKGAQVACTFGTCTAINIALQTASLAKGTYTGFVTVSDPNAIDSPQSISVTVQVGGSIPDSITLYAPPGGTATQSFSTGGNPKITTTTTSGGSGWLAVSMQGSGSFNFNVPYVVTASAGTLSANTYAGQLAITGSTFSPDNKNVPVMFTVTTQPIAQPIPAAITFTIAQGANKQGTNLSVSNGGQGTLTVSGVTSATSSGGTTWLTTSNSGNVVGVVADPTGLSPGQYNGTVTIASNAANASLQVPVTLIVVAQTPPAAFAGGAVNNANFAAGEPLAQGDIVALFGSQFTTGDPMVTSGIPLPTNPNGTQVFVNGTAAPIYYVSPGQIDFQLPFEARIGDGTIQVVFNGTAGNNIYVNVAARVPRVYVITNPAGQLVTSAKQGDILVIYGVGLGETSPAVATNTAAPSSPAAQLAGTTKACFGASNPFEAATCTNVQFAGLTPTYVGLYQINVQIPQGVTGSAVPITFTLPDGTLSNQLILNIQ